MEIAHKDSSTLLRRLNPGDWLYALALAGGALFALRQYGGFMDIYDKAILLLTVPGLAAMGFAWKPFRVFLAVSTALALASIALYQGDLARAEQVFDAEGKLVDETARGFLRDLLAALAKWTERVSLA